jgi:hypothetical protein
MKSSSSKLSPTYIHALLKELARINGSLPIRARDLAANHGGSEAAWRRWLSGKSPMPLKAVHWLEEAVARGGEGAYSHYANSCALCQLPLRRDGLPMIVRCARPYKKVVDDLKLKYCA